jgi:uncharacterized membrane protein YphA (DoxX/SURF4 family)
MSTALSLEHPATPTRALNVALWLGQVVLAAMFAMAGAMKAFTPLSELASQMPLATDAPALLRFIGISELAGSIGVILPALTRIKPWLTPLAAFGLFVIMVLASLFHLVRGEIGAIGVTAMLGAIAAFVAWGRAKRAPITAR